MKIIDSCATCLYDKQKNRVKNYTKEEQQLYLTKIKKMLDERSEDISAPHMVYLFNQVFEKQFGTKKDFGPIKKEYNDLVLSMEADLEKVILESENPLQTAFLYARIGNYIDFGAMNCVEKETFLSMFSKAVMREEDQASFEAFLKDCESAKRLLILADNCGEIVLDKLFVRRLKDTFPQLDISVMVRGEDALNDATREDAVYVGMDREADVISNGNGVTGTEYALLSDEARRVFDEADVILSKGQGNYESLAGCERKIYYSFLCKCALFTERFAVPALTGIFVCQRQ